VLLNGFKIPALSTRRTETELELQNGQTFAIAGLMNNQMNKTLAKIPGIGDIPILGLLFQSQAAQKDRTELVVMITPLILPNNSPGVTPNIPRMAEPYLPPLQQRKSLEMPPPAFVGPRGSAAAVPQTPGAVAQAPAPGAGPMPTAQSPSDASNPAAGAPTLQGLTPQMPLPQPSRELTPEEQKAFDRAQQLQTKKDAEANKRQAEAARRQGQVDRASQQAAAKRNAELAKKQAEADKKQAEADQKKQKEIAAADAKLKAAQAAYDAEMAKAKKKDQ